MMVCIYIVASVVIVAVLCHLLVDLDPFALYVVYVSAQAGAEFSLTDFTRH